MNSLFLLMMNFFNSSWLLTNSCNIMCINIDVIVIFLKNINMIYFINQSTIIKILLNVMFHAKFFNDDSFTTKFIIINIHKAFNAFSYVTSLYCLLWLILFHWQKLYFTMYCQTLSQQFWRLHLHQTKFLILLTFKCLLTLVLWHSLMTLSSFCETFFTWWVMTKFLVRISSLFFLKILLWMIFTFS